MSRLINTTLAALLVLGSAGCVKVRVDEPLVDLGKARSVGYRPQPVESPKPGVPDSQLTEQERLQRRLDQCQRDYSDLKRRLEKCEDQLEDCREKNDD